MEPESSLDEPLKMLVVGDAGVGKTSLLNRIYDGEFDEPKNDWDMKEATLTYDGVTRRVILSDTNGQERFRELTSSQFKNSDIVFIVFSVDDKESYDHVTRWLQEVDRYVTNKTIPRVIVANKIDLETRVVSSEESSTFALSNKAQYLETSAKTGQNVTDMVKLTFAPSLPEKKGGGCCLLQ